MTKLVSEARSETSIREAGKGGILGKNGVMTITSNDKLETAVEECDKEGRWTVTRIGDTIFISTYLAPSEPAGTLRKFNNLVKETARKNNAAPIIVMGDWNARHTRLGDRITTSDRDRREWIEEWLNDGEWNWIEPVSGKWTTRATTGGRGITDLVFANHRALARISNLTVWEDEIAANSDHSLITFEVSGMEQHEKPTFERIDIRKLMENIEEYANEVGKKQEEVEEWMMNKLLECEAANTAGEEWDWGKRRGMADEAWRKFAVWIYEAGKKAGGMMKFRGGATGAPLFEQHVKKLKEWRRDIQLSISELGISQAQRESRIRQSSSATKIINRAVRRSRKRLFNETNDSRSYNPTGESKRIACACSHCTLKSDNMADYEAHFKRTLQAQPTGTDQHNIQGLHITDPTHPVDLPCVTR
ncbi:hypothetical protein HK100_000131, partial [Physocladia obscura]